MLTNGNNDTKIPAWQQGILLLLKPIQNQPLAFITLIALAAAAAVYHDMRTLIQAQTVAYQQISQTLAAMEVRLQEIEKRIENK